MQYAVVMNGIDRSCFVPWLFYAAERFVRFEQLMVISFMMYLTSLEGT